MVNGVLQLNPKLQGHPKMTAVALTAITRIDFSHNQLTNLPVEIFGLISLKYDIFYKPPDYFILFFFLLDI